MRALRALLLLLLVRSALAAQAPRSLSAFSLQTYTTKSGLASNLITGMVQDREGFLWLATPEGLTRFDGAEFATLDRRTDPVLSTSSIRSVTLDRRGRVVL